MTAKALKVPAANMDVASLAVGAPPATMRQTHTVPPSAPTQQYPRHHHHPHRPLPPLPPPPPHAHHYPHHYTEQYPIRRQQQRPMDWITRTAHHGPAIPSASTYEYTNHRLTPNATSSSPPPAHHQHKQAATISHVSPPCSTWVTPTLPADRRDIRRLSMSSSTDAMAFPGRSGPTPLPPPAQSYGGPFQTQPDLPHLNTFRPESGAVPAFGSRSHRLTPCGVSSPSQSLAQDYYHHQAPYHPPLTPPCKASLTSVYPSQDPPPSSLAPSNAPSATSLPASSMSPVGLSHPHARVWEDAPTNHHPHVTHYQREICAYPHHQHQSQCDLIHKQPTPSQHQRSFPYSFPHPETHQPGESNSRGPGGHHPPFSHHTCRVPRDFECTRHQPKLNNDDITRQNITNDRGSPRLGDTTILHKYGPLTPRSPEWTHQPQRPSMHLTDSENMGHGGGPTDPASEVDSYEPAHAHEITHLPETATPSLGVEGPPTVLHQTRESTSIVDGAPASSSLRTQDAGKRRNNSSATTSIGSAFPCIISDRGGPRVQTGTDIIPVRTASVNSIISPSSPTVSPVPEEGQRLANGHDDEREAECEPPIAPDLVLPSAGGPSDSPESLLSHPRSPAATSSSPSESNMKQRWDSKLEMSPDKESGQVASAAPEEGETVGEEEGRSVGVELQEREAAGGRTELAAPPESGPVVSLAALTPCTDVLATFHYTRPSDLLFPSLKTSIGSLIQVHIPVHWLTLYNRNVARRYIWGNELYTDDSDVVAMLFHGGWLDKEGRLVRSGDTWTFNADGGYTTVKALTVTLRILPALPTYIGSTSKLMTSRSYSGHDGMTLKVESVVPSDKVERSRSKVKLDITAHYRRQSFSKCGALARRCPSSTMAGIKRPSVLSPRRNRPCKSPRGQSGVDATCSRGKSTIEDEDLRVVFGKRWLPCIKYDPRRLRPFPWRKLLDRNQVLVLENDTESFHLKADPPGVLSLQSVDTSETLASNLHWSELYVVSFGLVVRPSNEVKAKLSGRTIDAPPASSPHGQLPFSQSCHPPLGFGDNVQSGGKSEKKCLFIEVKCLRWGPTSQ